MSLDLNERPTEPLSRVPQHRRPEAVRYRRTARRRIVLVLAVVLALALAPVAVHAFAGDPPADDDTSQQDSNVVPGLDTSGLTGAVNTDSATGGALPSLPVPANPVPGELPAVPTGLDPRGTEIVPDGPVTIQLRPNGGSGVSGTLTVDGRDVTGKATGMKPGNRYTSLFYGDMSTARPGQTFTCADARTAAFTRGWMISGEWKVAADGSGTLSGTAPRSLADGVYTASIRRVPGTALSDPGVGFTPVQYPVVACGAVPPSDSD